MQELSEMLMKLFDKFGADLDEEYLFDLIEDSDTCGQADPDD